MFLFVHFLGGPKTTKADKTKKPPTTKRTVQVKNCDDDDDIREEDDQTMSGKIVVQSCPCEKRFKNDRMRLAALSAALAKQLRVYYQQLYNTNINYRCSVNVLSGNKTHTVFAYTVNIPKAEHRRARTALKLLCKDEEVKKTIETESIKREGDEDSDSSSAEEDESVETISAGTKKATVAPKGKSAGPETTQNQAESRNAASVTTKVATKSGKTLKPSKPSTVDCDKDHKVTVQDDKNINGVLIVRSCHASRFARKRSRCTNVGNKLGSLLKNQLEKVGVKGQFPVNIVKTSGDKTQTEFHYTLPCDKAQHQTVMKSLKDTCKDKDLIDTITTENQPDEDDSSSESEEETAQPTRSKVTPSGMTHSVDASWDTTMHTTQKSAIEPSATTVKQNTYTTKSVLHQNSYGTKPGKVDESTSTNKSSAPQRRTSAQTRGPKGPQGPQAPHETEGPKAPHEPHETEGPKGPHEPHETEAPKAPHGPHETEGPKGPHGPHETEGPKGPHGPEQTQGPKGPHGPHETEGPKGPHGPKETQGPKGPHGPHETEEPSVSRGPCGPLGPCVS
ncbi:unnamed protein product, partial [Rotaria sp. Silwood2]